MGDGASLEAAMGTQAFTSHEGLTHTSKLVLAVGWKLSWAVLCKKQFSFTGVIRTARLGFLRYGSLTVAELCTSP